MIILFFILIYSIIIVSLIIILSSLFKLLSMISNSIKFNKTSWNRDDPTVSGNYLCQRAGDGHIQMYFWTGSRWIDKWGEGADNEVEIAKWTYKPK